MKSQPMLNSFVEYCEMHPDERFWQALANWAKFPYLGYAANSQGAAFHDLWHKED